MVGPSYGDERTLCLSPSQRILFSRATLCLLSSNVDNPNSFLASSAKKILGAIKHTLYDAPHKCKLLAYTSLCRPILEYADVVWDPTRRQTVNTLEMVQNEAVRFIASLKGQESVSDARELLGLSTLEDRRQCHRVALLKKILREENRHSALSSAYGEIINDQSSSTMTTRAAERSEMQSTYAASQVYHGSFLPRTIRDMRAKIQDS